MALEFGMSELSIYASIYFLAFYVNFRATLFALILPLVLVRIGLMCGNWAQHAFVDDVKPDSDFRSSVTLIDVAVGLPRSPSRPGPLLINEGDSPALIE